MISHAHMLTAILAYLVGSIPFGLLLTKAAGLGDIRTIGSGNVGATNVLRTGNKKIAALTLLLDGGKGALAVALANLWGGDLAPELASQLAIVAGLMAVVGHNFPLWLKFKGGKGVATTLGVLLAIAWPVGIAACLTWLAVAIILRYSSLAAIVAFAASPFYAWWLADENITVLAALLAVLGIARHHANIRRLLKGEESRIGRKPSEKSNGEPA